MFSFCEPPPRFGRSAVSSVEKLMAGAPFNLSVIFASIASAFSFLSDGLSFDVVSFAQLDTNRVARHRTMISKWRLPSIKFPRLFVSAVASAWICLSIIAFFRKAARFSEAGTRTAGQSNDESEQ
jgi:hypothetical protein